MSELVETLVAEYREQARIHGKATIEGNFRDANRSHDILIDLVQKIRACGKEGEAALLVLTTDTDLSVRCWAATHALPFDEKSSLAVLEKISKQPGLIGFNAQMVMKQWKKGEL